MIRYALKCPDGHSFESWFASTKAFDGLAAAGQLSCPTCGASKIEKAIMAPRVSNGAQEAGGNGVAMGSDLGAPASEMEAAIAKLKAEVERNADYVGAEFTREARAMHDGDIPQRAIYGEAPIKDAKSLIEDGVPVMPLPFAPKRKVN
ncbi:DUF1178 family protein [Celeribacter arenosi]|uniref:DUF1178 family protein n=1 Tax=Celeribacter arenosi TaxID=792649 RepID=A0ABP7K893_9RHOB